MSIPTIPSNGDWYYIDYMITAFTWLLFKLIQCSNLIRGQNSQITLFGNSEEYRPKSKYSHHAEITCQFAGISLLYVCDVYFHVKMTHVSIYLLPH